MRTIKPNRKGAPFYNAFIRTGRRNGTISLGPVGKSQTDARLANPKKRGRRKGFCRSRADHGTKRYRRTPPPLDFGFDGVATAAEDDPAPRAAAAEEDGVSPRLVT